MEGGSSGRVVGGARLSIMNRIFCREGGWSARIGTNPPDFWMRFDFLPLVVIDLAAVRMARENTVGSINVSSENMVQTRSVSLRRNTPSFGPFTRAFGFLVPDPLWVPLRRRNAPFLNSPFSSSSLVVTSPFSVSLLDMVLKHKLVIVGDGGVGTNPADANFALTSSPGPNCSHLRSFALLCIDIMSFLSSTLYSHLN